MTSSIASTESIKKRIRAHSIAGKHFRMTSKESSDIDDKDGQTTVSIVSTDIKNSKSL